MASHSTMTMERRRRITLPRRSTLAAGIVVFIFLMSVPLAGRAIACRTGGITYAPAAGNFGVGQFTSSESYRGVHGGISVGGADAPPNVDSYHISVQISSSETSAGSLYGEIWSQVGWQMGILVRLPSQQVVYSSSPTIYFEGIDNVDNFRDTFGAAETLGRYEVSEGGISPTGRWKYISWFQRGGTWFQAGYAELDRQMTTSNAFGEVTDTVNQTDACLRLSRLGSVHEVGSPDQLLVLTSGWIAWTTVVPTNFSPDNNYPYDYANFGNYDHFTVSGP